MFLGGWCATSISWAAFGAAGTSGTSATADSALIVRATLVVQGLSMPAVIRVLRLEADDGEDQQEDETTLHGA